MFVVDKNLLDKRMFIYIMQALEVYFYGLVKRYIPTALSLLVKIRNGVWSLYTA